MNKNTKTILLSLLACLLLITGFELGAGRLRFGSAILNDSTSALITTNKGFLVNGKLSTSNYADLSNGVRFADTNIYIDDDGLDMRFSTATNGSYIFETKSLTTLASIDSTNGLLQYLPGYSNNGRGLVKTKVIQSTLGSTTPGNFINIAHGISPVTKIVDWGVKIYDDSTSQWLATGYVASTGMTTGTSSSIGSTNASHFIPAASGNLKNSGDTIRWVIRYLGN
jgi:hypothetical protein